MSAELRDRLQRQLIDSTQEYIELGSDETILDGSYTADELRRIAEAMDLIKEKE